MDEQHLRVKIGDHEFEATGPAYAVASQFQAWKELISDLPTQPQDRKPEGRDEEPEGEGDGATKDAKLPSIFSQDKRGLISLSVHPRSNKKVADAMLLLLWGSRQTGEEELMVGKLKEALSMSGLKVDRVDRAIAPHLSAGYVLKGGSGKGGRYRLTNPGVQRAKEMIQELSS
jgi:hypothetical protein